MKKLFIGLLMWLFSLFLFSQQASAYTPDYKDLLIVKQLSNAIEDIIEDKWEEYRDIYIKRLDNIKNGYKSDLRIVYIIEWTIDKLSQSNLVDDILNQLSESNCVIEWWIVGSQNNPMQCCAWLKKYEYIGGSSICYNPNKWNVVCDYPERIKNWYQWPFYEAPYLIYDNWNWISSDPSFLGSFQCEIQEDPEFLKLKSKTYPSYLDNSVGVWYTFDAWWFKLTAVWSDMQIESITIRQRGTLNGTEFEEVSIIRVRDGKNMGSCNLDLNETCTINVDFNLEEWDDEDFYLETEIEYDSEEWETIQFQIKWVEVENDDTLVEITANPIPLLINRKLVVEN